MCTFISSLDDTQDRYTLNTLGNSEFQNQFAKNGGTRRIQGTSSVLQHRAWGITSTGFTKRYFLEQTHPFSRSFDSEIPFSGLLGVVWYMFVFAIITNSKFWFALSILASFCLFIYLVVVALIHLISNISEDFKLEQSMRFLVEIRNMKPDMDIPKWGIVASRMNDYLFETAHYPTKYAFYGGKSCRSEFKEVYLLPRKKAFGVTPLNASIHGGNSGFDYFKRQVSKDYYNSYDEYLAKVHEESLRPSCLAV